MSSNYSAGIVKLETSNRTRRRALGIYQIFGGCIGLIWTMILLSQTYSDDLLLIIIMFILLFAFSITCGILLFMNHEKALSCSLVHQVIQLVSIYINGYGFVYASGFYLAMGIDLSEGGMFAVNAELSKLGFSMDDDNYPFRFMVNIGAAYLIYFIIELRRNMQKETVLKTAEDIATPASSTIEPGHPQTNL